MKITAGMEVIVTDNIGREFTGEVVNISDYREPCMKYAVDIGFDDFVFVGEESIRPTKKGGADNG
jgi:hypothetical protein